MGEIMFGGFLDQADLKALNVPIEALPLLGETFLSIVGFKYRCCH